MDEVTEAPSNEDQPAGTEEVTPIEETTPAIESFTDVDPSEKPEEITSEWLQERYKQMQADYTRKTQTISETAKQREEELEFLEALRSDPETQRAVLDELSSLLDESDVEDEDPEEVDPTEAVSRQVQEIRDQLDQERAQALGREISSHIEQLAKDAGVEMDEDDFNRIFGAATESESTIGKQHTEAAFKTWLNRESSRRDKWLKSYLASKDAPTQVPPGQPAQDKPDLSSHEGRVARMKAILEGGS